MVKELLEISLLHVSPLTSKKKKKKQIEKISKNEKDKVRLIVVPMHGDR